MTPAASAASAALPLAILALFCTLCAGAAMQDVMRLRIANSWSIALLVLGIAAFAIHPVDVIGHVVAFALVLAGGTLLFALGWFGGGDAKLLAAAACAFTPGVLPTLVATIAAAGAVVAVAAMARPGKLSERRARRIPYGLPIAVGAIVTGMGTGVYGQPGL